MKILIVSDTHGKIDEVLSFINEQGDIDLIIHLGDYSRDGYDISYITGIETEIVKGNCDWTDFSTPNEKILEIEGLRLFISHGHYLNVRKNIYELYQKVSDVKADIGLYGHNHYPQIDEIEGITLFNPGSPTEARNGSKRSLGLIDIKDENFEISIIEL